MGKIKVLIACHKVTPVINTEVFMPIHVGRYLASIALQEDMKDYSNDDAGDNISAKNVQFAEVTALYWAWKNLPLDVEYVGLMHYARYFNFSTKYYQYPDNTFNDLSLDVINKFDLTDQKVKQLCENYDLVLPEKWEMRKEHIEYEHKRYNYICQLTQEKLKSAPSVLNMYDHYCLTHVQADFDLAIEIIKKDFPYMVNSMEKSLNQTSARFTNMFLMKREFFDGYCEFLFSIFSKMEKEKDYFNTNLYQKGSFQSRIFGFLAERLFSIYIDYIISSSLVRHIDKQIVFAKFENNLINIVISSDNNYAPYLTTLLGSTFVNAAKEDKFQIFVLDGGISEKNKSKISQFVIRYNAKIDFIRVDEKEFKDSCILVESSKHITLPTYFRFAVARLLPKELSKVLYLDIDLIVTSSLRTLYSTDISNHFAAVVEDTFNDCMVISQKLKLKNKYFNAGVMLINLDKWREDNLEKKCLDNAIAIRNDICFLDQDVLNYTLDGKVKYLSFKYNLQQTAFHFTKQDVIGDDLEQSKAAPIIIHYSGHIKPWDMAFTSWHPLTKAFYRYWVISPYKLLFYKWKLKRFFLTMLHKIFKWRFEYCYLKHEKLKNFFDDGYYLRNNPDVLNAHIEPLLHYVKYGWKEGRNPSATFDTRNYLLLNEDVQINKINPLFHYLYYGLQERRKCKI